MPRNRRKHPYAILEGAKPGTLAHWLLRYLEWMQVQNYSELSVRMRRWSIGLFVEWCAERDVTKPEQVDRVLVERYKRHLHYYRKADGKPLNIASQHSRLLHVRSFLGWLVDQEVLASSPAERIEPPKLERKLPRHILTADEAEAILAVPDVKSARGIRDRAILEVLYSTGIRRRELVGLCLWDIDHERETLMVRRGKGYRDRMVPIGERALAWIAKYLEEARPALAAEPDDGALFLGRDGRPFTPDGLGNLVGTYVRAAGIEKTGSCHLFRHTVATLMLENGADVRFIQQMLGHENLTSTQLYTHVSIGQLQRVHSATHPAGRKEREATMPESDANPGWTSGTLYTSRNRSRQ